VSKWKKDFKKKKKKKGQVEPPIKKERKKEILETKKSPVPLDSLLNSIRPSKKN
jgi:hypothetical protein